MLGTPGYRSVNPDSPVGLRSQPEGSAASPPAAQPRRSPSAEGYEHAQAPEDSAASPSAEGSAARPQHRGLRSPPAKKKKPATAAPSAPKKRPAAPAPKAPKKRPAAAAPSSPAGPKTPKKRPPAEAATRGAAAAAAPSGSSGSSGSPAPSAGAETRRDFRAAVSAANRYKKQLAEAQTQAAALAAAQAAAQSAAADPEDGIPDASSEAAECSALILKQKIKQYQQGEDVDFTYGEKKLLYGRMRISGI